jgi:hypothetical protein
VEGDFEGRLRAKAFAYLDEISRRSGGPVTRAELEAFVFEGRRVPLIARQRGIWKPAELRVALSILTTYSPSPEARPYEDNPGRTGSRATSGGGSILTPTTTWRSAMPWRSRPR